MSRMVRQREVRRIYRNSVAQIAWLYPPGRLAEIDGDRRLAKRLRSLEAQIDTAHRIGDVGLAARMCEEFVTLLVGEAN